MDFKEFSGCGYPGNTPYPYQQSLAESREWPSLLGIPTGLGKTAAVLGGWCYRRFFDARVEVRRTTPRRLVYMLPMRVLCEQTFEEAQRWCRCVHERAEQAAEPRPAQTLGAYLVMGGEEPGDWDRWPEKPAILVGTQDMLLSRALNRGYAMGRYRWPVHFALLNSDCLWVFDETQLMSVGLTTSAQLQGLRRKLGVYGAAQSLWMSATLNSDRLSTVDHPRPDQDWNKLNFEDEDRSLASVRKLIEAAKPCGRADSVLSPDSSKNGYEEALAAEIVGAHRPGTLTLAVINRVDRAQTVFQAIQKLGREQDNGAEAILIHSRFRPIERGPVQKRALNIRDAVAACDRLLLVVGPKAVTSDYVAQEWRFAYFEADKCVNPIVRLDVATPAGQKIDGYDLIPEDLKLLHAEDFRDDARYAEHLENLVRQLSEPPPRVGKLVAVPELPPHFHQQRDRIKALRDMLLVDLQGPVVVTGAAARVGVQGMGGIGKSVLACALARRPEVRRAFPDGVFWIAIGQDPDLAALQRRLATELGDEALFDNTTQGKETLRKLLDQRATLLVLDDVWQRDHAEVFNVIGSRGRVLLTTRDSGLVAALAARENHYQVQLPTMAEAEALLTVSAETEIANLPPESREVIAECGRLPLGLALCGGMVAGGTGWADLLEALREHNFRVPLHRPSAGGAPTEHLACHGREHPRLARRPARSVCRAGRLRARHARPRGGR